VKVRKEYSITLWGGRIFFSPPQHFEVDFQSVGVSLKNKKFSKILDK
jgi:hypothetical protein